MMIETGITTKIRKILNENNIFIRGEGYKDLYNLVCAVMDRFDTSINWLNNHDKCPVTEEDFINYMLYAVMALDSIKTLLDKLSIDKEYIGDKYKYFEIICKKYELFERDKDRNITGQIIDDDTFFRYLRCLVFAHPFSTDKFRFLAKGEIRYSPWVICNKSTYHVIYHEQIVGVRIYYSNKSDLTDMIIPFKILREYIISRLKLMELVYNWYKDELRKLKIEWQKFKIDRELNPDEALQLMVNELKKRCEYESTIDTLNNLIGYLTCNISNHNNIKSVKIFRKAIMDRLEYIYNYFEKLDFESMLDIIYEVINCEMELDDLHIRYEMEKIFVYLDAEHPDRYSEDDKNFALEQVASFRDKIGHRWVDLSKIPESYLEIHTLVLTALYMELESRNNKL